MLKKYIFLAIIIGFFTGFIAEYISAYFGEQARDTRSLHQERHRSNTPIKTPIPTPKIYTIDSFLQTDTDLEKQIETILQTLSPEKKAGMVLMPAWENSVPLSEIRDLQEKFFLGGIFVLRKNFSPQDIASLQTDKNLPDLLSIDAEPSLLYKNFSDLDAKIKNTNQLNTNEQSQHASELIALEMKKYGFNINFAPVYDSGKNTSIIGNRAFSTNNSDTQKLATIFSQTLNEHNIFSTAKHFPGHGNVTEDSHYSLPIINGELIELENFEYAIEKNIPIIMVGHIAIKNNPEWNTDGIPASLSKKITTDLLRNQLGFKGIIITDAMNMGAVSSIPNAEIKALEAGADILLMPKNIETTYAQILNKIQTDKKFSDEIDEKIQKIIKLKLLLQKFKQLKDLKKNNETVEEKIGTKNIK